MQSFYKSVFDPSAINQYRSGESSFDNKSNFQFRILIQQNITKYVNYIIIVIIYIITVFQGWIKFFKCILSCHFLLLI